MIALIDGDLIAYRCAASIKPDETLEIGCGRIDQLMQTILVNVGAKSYYCFLSGSGNFRKHINPGYKAHRKDIEPPKHLEDCREYLITQYGAKLAHNIEADDKLGHNQGLNTVICSLDKDMLMIPGNHHSWEIRGTAPSGTEWIREAKTVVVKELEADKHFWKQMLIGDKADDIVGVQGIGPKRADNYINPCEDNQECLEVVLDLYENDFDRIITNAHCLWIQRHDASFWTTDLNICLPVAMRGLNSKMEETIMEYIHAS